MLHPKGVSLHVRIVEIGRYELLIRHRGVAPDRQLRKIIRPVCSSGKVAGSKAVSATSDVRRDGRRCSRRKVEKQVVESRIEAHGVGSADHKLLVEAGIERES